MKKIIFGLNLILVLSLLGLAQKPEKNPQVKNTGKASSAATVNGPALAAGTVLNAQLEQTLDVKKARVGDQVILKVTKSVKQNGETIIPKGANLIGRVTQVQQKTKDNAVSRLGVVFDRIRGQNLNTPVSATIVAITNAGANLAAGDSDISGTSSSSTRVMGQSSTSNTNNSSGGGLLGGVTNTVGGVVNTTTNTVGGVTSTAGQTLGNTRQTLGQTVGGIQISSSAGASASGSTTLSAANKNLRLEKGANFQMQLNAMGGN
jgi:hypothetical protein